MVEEAKIDGGSDPVGGTVPRSRALLLGAGAAGMGLAALAVARSRRSGSNEEVSYPPLDRLKPAGAGIWIVDSGPFSAMGLKLPVRMTVLRLANGDLLLHSPTRFDADLLRALEAIGPVRHLMAPATGHWTFVKDWQQAVPEATTWAVPVLLERPQVRRSGLRIDAVLEGEAPEAWGGVQQGIVRGGGGFEEAWLFHHESRTLVLTDLVQNLDPAKLPPATALLMRGAQATRATTALHVRAALLAKREEARGAVKDMLATEPEMVVFAHGDPFRGRGAAQLQRAFAWLV